MAWDANPLSSRIVSSREGGTFKEGKGNELLCHAVRFHPVRYFIPIICMGKLKFREVKSPAHVTQLGQVEPASECRTALTPKPIISVSLSGT